MSTPQGQAGVGRGRFLVARQVTTITDKSACIVTTMVIKTTIVMKMIRRTLPAGSLILDESPLVVAPKTSVTLTCVNCCSRCDRHHKFQIMVTIIMSNMTTIRIGIPYLPCAGCGFPLCATCQPSTASTSQPEPPSSLACQSSPPSLSPASGSAWRTPTRASSATASSPPLAPASSPFRALPASSDSPTPSHRTKNRIILTKQSGRPLKLKVVIRCRKK